MVIYNLLIGSSCNKPSFECRKGYFLLSDRDSTFIDPMDYKPNGFIIPICYAISNTKMANILGSYYFMDYKGAVSYCSGTYNDARVYIPDVYELKEYLHSMINGDFYDAISKSGLKNSAFDYRAFLNSFYPSSHKLWTSTKLYDGSYISLSIHGDEVIESISDSRDLCYVIPFYSYEHI